MCVWGGGGGGGLPKQNLELRLNNDYAVRKLTGAGWPVQQTASFERGVHPHRYDCFHNADNPTKRPFDWKELGQPLPTDSKVPVLTTRS